MSKNGTRKMSKREAGRLGGLATVRKHGVQHMWKIASKGGKKGFHTFCERYFEGDKDRAMCWLMERSMFLNDPAPWNGAFQDPGPLLPGDDLPF